MSRKLLLADDSVTIQKVVGISFANHDVEIETVDNGDDAVARVRDAAPDIVLADVVMPGKNGYEVCEAVKRDPQTAHIPVLLLTGTFEAFDEARSREVQADGHITKPFEAQSLVDEVNRLLSRAERAPAPPAEAPAPEAATDPIGEEIDVAPPGQPATPLPGQPAASPPPGDPGASGSGDAFDFFDDIDADLGEASPAEPSPAPAAPEATSTPATTAYEVDAGESAFDFAPVVEEQPAAVAPEAPTVVTPDPSETPTPPPAAHPDETVAVGHPDQTVAMIPPQPERPAEDGWPSNADLDAAFDEDSLSGLSAPDLDLPAEPGPGAEAPAAERPTVLSLDDPEPPTMESAPPADDLDFGFDAPSSAPAPTPAPEPSADPLAGFDAPDVARETVLDPDDQDAFAVSSSDLGDPLQAPADSAPPPPAFADLDDDLPALPVEPAAPEPAAFETEMPEPEPTFEPEPAELPVEPVFDAEPAAAEPPPTAPAAEPSTAEAGPDLTPMMRERVHESLEKVAWEAFADLPDTIVRQALATIEEIAWEVIPQMAEALIREEIRRMKGETD